MIAYQRDKPGGFESDASNQRKPKTKFDPGAAPPGPLASPSETTPFRLFVLLPLNHEQKPIGEEPEKSAIPKANNSGKW